MTWRVEFNTEWGCIHTVYSGTVKMQDARDATAESEGLKNIVLISDQSEGSKINLEDESIDAMLFYDILHYMDLMERNKLYNDSYRVLKNDALLSVYPKHNKLDEPLWNLSDMQLEDVIKEIESVKFNFEG